MRLQVEIDDSWRHEASATCAFWVSNNEIISTGDDRVVKLISLSKNHISNLLTFPDNVFPVAISACPPRQSTGSGFNKSSTINTFAISSTNGFFHLINKSGRIEKSVEAHRGAILGLRWSYSSDSFATCGEDGQIKLWSRSGMLRSTLIQKNLSIYSLAWGPRSEQIVYSSGKQLIIIAIKWNVAPLTWTAHDGLILKVDWSPVSDLIISGGEDCKYKVWDGFGRLLFSSRLHDHPICSLSWKPSGDQFVVGSYNCITLCDKLGWTENVQKPETGSLFDVNWSLDGAKIVAACANGRVIVAQILGHRIEWMSLEVFHDEPSTITMRNACDDSSESLQMRQNILQFSLAHGHLVAITSNHCYIYNVKSVNTPVIVDLRDSCISLIVQSQDIFTLVDCGNLVVYNYSGRLTSTLRNPAIRTDFAYPGCISLSYDTIATKDTEDEKVIHLFEVNSGKPVGDGKPIIHCSDVVTLGLNQKESIVERRLAVLDRNKDLFIYQVRIYGCSRPVIKLGSVVYSFHWSETQNFIAAIRQEKLVVWYYPSISQVDKELVDITQEEKDIIEGGGKYCVLISFHDNQVTIRRPEKTILSFSISPIPALLSSLINKNKWDQAIQLCRNVKNPLLWACLAGSAAATQNLDLAEVAYSALNKPEKVEHIRRIRRMESGDEVCAQKLLLAGQFNEAERILLQGGLHFSAMMLCLAQFQWERSLDLACKNELFTSIVVSARHHYLTKLGCSESLRSFLNCQHQKVLDEEALRQVIKEEYLKESTQNG